MNYEPPQFAQANRTSTITVAALYNSRLSTVTTPPSTLHRLTTGSQYRC